VRRSRTTNRSQRCLIFIALIATANSCAGGGACCAPPPPVCPTTFVNPVATQGQDPWVLRRDGSYYLIESRDGGIWVSKSDRLTQARKNSVRIWTPPSSGWNRANVWAPELHYIDGKWYVYYAAGPSGTAPATFINQRSFVLRSTATDPQGTYEDLGMLYTGDDIAGSTDPKWAIDLTVARIGGQLYAVWSGWEFNNTATDRTPQHLYIARMSDPATISSNRVKLSSPVESWERGTELDLQEGPEFLEHAGQIFVVYSARESWLKEYKLGQLRLTSAGADPMNPASWVKSGPVFTGTDQVYGVGHASFTTSPDGTEDWIVYHSKISTTPGWDRDIRAQKFGWNADGSPNFGVPIPAGQPVSVPSGECQ
jgi:GH43 family beta-xylosidase